MGSVHVRSHRPFSRHDAPGSLLLRLALIPANHPRIVSRARPALPPASRPRRVISAICVSICSGCEICDGKQCKNNCPKCKRCNKYAGDNGECVADQILIPSANRADQGDRRRSRISVRRARSAIEGTRQQQLSGSLRNVCEEGKCRKCKNAKIANFATRGPEHVYAVILCVSAATRPVPVCRPARAG